MPRADGGSGAERGAMRCDAQHFSIACVCYHKDDWGFCRPRRGMQRRLTRKSGAKHPALGPCQGMGGEATPEGESICH